MTRDNELMVMRAAGISAVQLERRAMLIAFLTTVVVYSITIYFLPISYQAFKELQFRLRNDYSTVLLQEGTFNTVADGVTVYVRERSSGGELRGILVHDTRDPKRPVSMLAERGALVRSEAGPRVVMVNGNRQQLEGGGGRFTEMILRPRVTVAAGTDVTKALALHEAAHHDCFIAASMNFPVRHEAEVIPVGG